MKKFLEASGSAIEDLELIAPPNQHPSRRMYHHGYEHLFNEMPVLHQHDPLLNEKAAFSKAVMEKLAVNINYDGWPRLTCQMPGEFARTVLAMEKPIVNETEHHEGSEFVVAHWGSGFRSPVHGHATGFEFEAVLDGKIRVNSYRMIHPHSNHVRLVETSIISKGTFVAQYNTPGNYAFKRPALIHNFVAIEPSNTLHYLSEHTREGRDNGFIPDYFEDYFGLSSQHVTRTEDMMEAMYSPNGSIYLVRSANVPEYGDHYIVITGMPIMKEHGLRPKEVALEASATASKLLDEYPMPPHYGLILLKLNPVAQAAFHEFHGITVVGNTVIMPKQVSLTID